MSEATVGAVAPQEVSVDAAIVSGISELVVSAVCPALLVLI